jgi:hypothetical protein
MPKVDRFNPKTTTWKPDDIAMKQDLPYAGMPIPVAANLNETKEGVQNTAPVVCDRPRMA